MNSPGGQRDLYRRYYERVGNDRNDLRTNRGVLFQTLGFEASFINACYKIDHDPGTARVLDVGCGSAGTWYQLLRLGYRAANIVGIDLQMERISAATTLHPAAAVVCGDATSLGFRDATFDLVYESTLFVTIADNRVRAEVAAEMVRVCRPGGYLLLVDWRTPRPWDRSYQALTRAEIKNLFRLGGSTSLVGAWRGALVPPVGRFLSSRATPLYFLVAAVFPLLVGQMAFLLRKH